MGMCTPIRLVCTDKATFLSPRNFMFRGLSY